MAEPRFIYVDDTLVRKPEDAIRLHAARLMEHFDR